MNIKKIKYTFITARTLVSLISNLISIIYISIQGSFNFSSLFQSCSIFFITGAGFIFNDIYDIKKDKAANKNRPVCKGLLTIPEAIWGATIFTLIALLMPVIFVNLNGFYVILLTAFGIVFYSPFSKRFSLFKGLYTSLLCCLPILYAGVLSNHYSPYLAYLSVICFITGREILLDIYDAKGDSKSYNKTIPLVFGFKKSLFLSRILMFLSIPILLLFCRLNIWVLSSTSIILLGMVYCNYLPLDKEERVVNITRLIIVISSVSLAYT